MRYIGGSLDTPRKRNSIQSECLLWLRQARRFFACFSGCKKRMQNERDRRLTRRISPSGQLKQAAVRPRSSACQSEHRTPTGALLYYTHQLFALSRVSPSSQQQRARAYTRRRARGNYREHCSLICYNPGRPLLTTAPLNYHLNQYLHQRNSYHPGARCFIPL